VFVTDGDAQGFGQWAFHIGAGVEGERFDGGGEPVGGEGSGDPPVRRPADGVFAQVDGARVGQAGVEGLFLVFEFAAVVDVVADGGGLRLPSAQRAADPSAQNAATSLSGQCGDSTAAASWAEGQGMPSRVSWAAMALSRAGPRTDSSRRTVVRGGRYGRRI
jgi:hypothetical protein